MLPVALSRGRPGRYPLAPWKQHLTRGHSPFACRSTRKHSYLKALRRSATSAGPPAGKRRMSLFVSRNWPTHHSLQARCAVLISPLENRDRRAPPYRCSVPRGRGRERSRQLTEEPRPHLVPWRQLLAASRPPRMWGGARSARALSGSVPTRVRWLSIKVTPTRAAVGWQGVDLAAEPHRVDASPPVAITRTVLLGPLPTPHAKVRSAESTATPPTATQGCLPLVRRPGLPPSRAFRRGQAAAGIVVVQLRSATLPKGNEQCSKTKNRTLPTG